MIIPFKRLFFSGIGGSGMSALALFLAGKGHTVVGSDRAFDSNPSLPASKALLDQGISIVPQNGSGLDSSFDLAVFSTAVEADHPEMKAAHRLDIPVKTRPDVLADMSSLFSTVAVTGTSGKSTVSGMLTFLMHGLGLRPNFIGGGRVRQFGIGPASGNALVGDSKTLVIEACESDGTIVNYKPRHSVVLNLSLDHHAIDKTSELFRTFIGNTKDVVVLNADDPRLLVLSKKEPVTFSIATPSQYRAEKIIYRPMGTDFSVRGTRFTLSLPGAHNLSNALACIAMLSELHISLEDIAAHLPDFTGIERRFDVHLNDGTFLVIDDYAHNPHKISSLMETVSHFRERICYIFQPHGFAPTRMMKNEYIAAFADYLRPADHLILLPVFYAGGTVSKDISSHNIVEPLKALGRSAMVVESREKALGLVNDFPTVVVMGARDDTLSDLASTIALFLSAKGEHAQ